MDVVIEYVFGVGDGHPHTWESPADADLDGDGSHDAVWLDFDGDSRRDDAMWDTDGDGRADVAALDLDDDGRPEHFYRDDGSGVWGRGVPEPHRPAAGARPPPPGRVDVDHDGRPDVALTGGGAHADRMYVDENGDGRFDRVLVDTDGDGRADVSFPWGSPQFGRP